MLIFSTYFQSPLGLIHLNSDGKFLTGAYFQDHENLKNQSTTVFKEDLKIFQEAKTFLNDYFQKRNINVYDFSKVYEYDESIIPDMIEYGFTMSVRPSAKFKEQLDSLMASLPKEETVFIYSQYKGYICPENKAYNADTDKFVHSHGWAFEYLHTSGHASREALAKVCSLVNPSAAIIPIHTEKGSDFTSLDITDELKNKVVTSDTVADGIEIHVR